MIVLYRGGIASKEQEATAAERGMSYAVIEGIQKIRVAGAEKRAFARWANLYADEVGYTYNANPFARALPVVNTAVTSIRYSSHFLDCRKCRDRDFGLLCFRKRLWDGDRGNAGIQQRERGACEHTCHIEDGGGDT